MDYKVILSWLLSIQDKIITQDIIDSGLQLMRAEFQKDLHKNTKDVRAYMNKKYYSFLNDSFKQKHKGMSAYTHNDISKEFRKALERRILHSLQAIKIKDQQLLLDLESRFLSFITDEKKEKSLQNLKDNLAANKSTKIAKNYVKNVVSDQVARLNDDIDSIHAKLNGALGLIWHTMEDTKVVGNPSGKYPKGNELHNDHYKRNNVFFALKNSYATKKGLLKADIFEDLEDIKKVGRGLNCRCYYEYIYDLRDVPKEYLAKGI